MLICNPYNYIKLYGVPLWCKVSSIPVLHHLGQVNNLPRNGNARETYAIKLKQQTLNKTKTQPKLLSFETTWSVNRNWTWNQMSQTIIHSLLFCRVDLELNLWTDPSDWWWYSPAYGIWPCVRLWVKFRAPLSVQIFRGVNKSSVNKSKRVVASRSQWIQKCTYLSQHCGRVAEPFRF